MLNDVQNAFILEQWLEYGIGMSIFVLRFYARWKSVGFEGYSWDDLFAGLSMIFFTFDPALLNVVITHGSFVGLTDETAELLTPPVIESFTTGSKALFAAWFTYVTLIWTLKGQVLGYYNRLTAGTWQHKWVKVMAVVCFVSWISLILLIFCRCTPIQRNWQIVPYAGDQCTRTTSTVVLLMVLNILNDIGLVLIPANVLWSAKIPLKRKLLISVLLSSSFFIIACALLRGILGLQSINNIVVSIQWGTRETFVTIIVICVPPIKPLFSSSGSSHFGSSQELYATGTGTGTRWGGAGGAGGSKNHAIPLKDSPSTAAMDRDLERSGTSSVRDVDLQSLGSSKDLIEDREASKAFASPATPTTATMEHGAGISVRTEFTVSNSQSHGEMDGQQAGWSRHESWTRVVTRQ
ncbi:uncharacterized protein LTHEOB_1559 [Lasiodiplodia theobromae]|uniref:Rhodopsin domain-containing protein n=1 Tax=Lasiodiplodia theobromae TaxID=45133 RepID=A0A5N5DMC6_9PEZI|nr:uncharacterized protein LTHEOB_1559 [Lasiodiplodia theobromae]KAB2579088.1 hypothetical protein DBV05_g2149 [Lasiodiplodia theobromae]KAF4537368.1 hypothetical protein LTHEOB_1559 [Lasiodiplodia theobromae]